MRNGLKTLILMFISLGLFLSAKAQKNKSADVPVLVLKAFKIKYPKAANVDWDTSTEISGAYEADYTIEKDKYTSVFNLKGDWLETNMDMDKLPDPIIKTIGAEFADHEIIESQHVESPIRGIYYRVLLEKNPSERWEVQFLESGSIVQKEHLGEDDK